MKYILLILVFFISFFSLAEEPEKTSSVIDFEGDVIEGERKRPYLFIQTGGDSSSLDSMLFLRNDFNDFHEVDKKRRPSFIPSKKQRK